MITLSEYLMGRDSEYPLTVELALNVAKLLGAINYLRGRWGWPLTVSSGYRPGKYNKAAGGALRSAHLTCEAIDLADLDGGFAVWCLKNLEELEKAGLWMENPKQTKGWLHLQVRPVPGKRVFDK